MELEPVKTKMNEDLLMGLRREDTGRVVLMYSGGVDSTVAGLMLQEQGKDVYPLFIDYGQSSVIAERQLVENVPVQLGFQPTQVVETDLLKKLTKSKLLGEESKDDSDAWVPGRNTLFMVIAGIFAEQIDGDGIAIGYMLDDNFVFGDNDYFHHKGMEEVLSKSFLRPMQVFLPTRSLTKKDLLKRLTDAGMLDLTVSCWNARVEDSKIITCQECANCQERNRNIKELSP